MYKLKKAFYGLKQAPRACRLHSYHCENQFQRSENGPTLYIKKKENNILIICIYIDDIIYIGLSQYLIDEFKLSMMSKFDPLLRSSKPMIDPEHPIIILGHI